MLDRVAITELLKLLRRGLVDADDVAEVGCLVMRALDAQALSFGPGFGFSSLATIQNVDHAWMEHHTRYRAWDRSAEFLLGSGGAPFRVMTHSNEHERRGPLFNGLARHGFADAAIGRYDAIGARHYMAVYRAKGARPFDDDAALLLQLLQPHFEHAFGTALARAALEDDGRGAVPPRPVPLAWVDLPSERVHFAPQAHSTLVAELGLETEAQRTRFAAMLVARARRGHDGAPPPLAVSARYRIEGAVVDADRSGPRPKGNVPRRVLFVLCARPPTVADEELLMLLTPAQRAVALRAAQGESLKKVAKDLGISYATARVHLRDVYRRLEVRGRDELRARFMRL